MTYHRTETSGGGWPRREGGCETTLGGDGGRRLTEEAGTIGDLLLWSDHRRLATARIEEAGHHQETPLRDTETGQESRHQVTETLEASMTGPGRHRDGGRGHPIVTDHNRLRQDSIEMNRETRGKE